MSEVLRAVSFAFEVRWLEFVSTRRTARVAIARFAAYYLARNLTNASLSMIGNAMGGRDHTTVLHGITRAIAMMDTDPDFRRRVEHVSARFSQPQPRQEPRPMELSDRLLAAVRDRSLSSSQRVILADLIARAAPDGVLAVAIDDVMRATDISETTLITSIERLAFLGRIDSLKWTPVTHGGQRGKPGRREFHARLTTNGEG